MSDTASKVSWGAPLVSAMVLAIYVVALGAAYLSADKEMLHTLTIVAATNATAVVSYWVGSSVGSARKDQIIAAQAASPNETTLKTAPVAGVSPV